MKKLLTLPLLVALATPVSADTIFGVYAGGGIWNTSMDGNVGVGDEPITAKELGLGSENNTHYYIAVEHIIPVIPNIRLAHTVLSVKGDSMVSREFSLETIDEKFTVGTQASTDIDLSHTDATLYYEILDNWVSLDIGLTARMISGYAEITATPEDESLTARQEKVALDATIPMLYGKAQFDLPFTGWYIGGNINYISLSDNTFSDIEAKVGYMTDGLVLDFGIEAGFRQMNLLSENSDDLNVDLTIDGPYAELIVHF